MARDGRGPANSPEQMLQRQIDELTDRVRKLERNKTLAAPVTKVHYKTDPDHRYPEQDFWEEDEVEGQVVIDQRDHTLRWFVDNHWHQGCPYADGYTYVLEYPFIDNGFGGGTYQVADPLNWHPYGNENFYEHEDYPSRVYCKTGGLYMTFWKMQFTNFEVGKVRESTNAYSGYGDESNTVGSSSHGEGIFFLGSLDNVGMIDLSGEAGDVRQICGIHIYKIPNDGFEQPHRWHYFEFGVVNEGPSDELASGFWSVIKIGGTYVPGHLGLGRT